MRRGGSEGLIAILIILVMIGYALMYAAIAAGIGLAIYGLFLLFKFLFIGRAKKTKADPLFTKAAKTAVKKKGFVRQDFAQRNSLSDERVDFIITQLRIAGIIDGSSVLIDKQWGLHSVFKSINSDDDFFISRIQDEINSIVSSIDDQLRDESNLDFLSVLELIKGNAEVGMKMSYLRTKLLAIRDYADQSEIDVVQEQINGLSAQGNVIDLFEEDTVMQVFDEFESYLANSTSVKTWNSDHQRIDISQESFCDIHINGQSREVPYIASNAVEVYFYPSFTIVYRRYSETQKIQVLDFQSYNINTTSFTEPPSVWFDEKDATVAYHTWLHSRVNGGPDLRYKNNPSTPHYSFYKASISPIGIEIISGSSKTINDIKKAFGVIKTLVTVRNKPQKETMMTYSEKTGIDKPSIATYLDLQQVFKEMVSVYDCILPNESLCEIIDTEIHMPQPNGKDVEISYKVMLVMFIDLIKCYQGMGHPIDFEKRDSYLLPMITNLKFRNRMTTEIEFMSFMNLNEVAFIYKNLLLSFEDWAKGDGSGFLLPRFAQPESEEICYQYLILMISASNYIRRANPGSYNQEKKWFEFLSKNLAEHSSICCDNT